MNEHDNNEVKDSDTGCDCCHSSPSSQSSPTETVATETKAPCCCPLREMIDFPFIQERAKLILTSPGSSWFTLKNDGMSIRDLLVKLFIPLFAINALLAYVSFLLYYRGTIFSGLVFHIFTSIVFPVLFIYGLTYAVKAIVGRFEGQLSLDDAFKLITYPMITITGSRLIGILPVGEALHLVVSLLLLGYAGFIFYTGIPIMAGVPPHRQKALCLVSVLIGIIVASILSALACYLPSPSYFDPSSIDPSSLHDMLRENLRGVE